MRPQRQPPRTGRPTRCGRPGPIARHAWGWALWLAALPALGHELTEASRREIAELLVRVEKSGCQFNRSGSWYSGAEARAHLQRKYEYLAARRKLGSTEDFVVHAATKSSMSGEPYQMRCGSAAPTAASTWIDGELRRMRAPPPPPPPGK